MAQPDGIADAVKTFILHEYLPGEDPAALQETTPLITGGVLDSVATLKLVAFLEEKFNIELAAHEVGVDHLNTLRDIAALVASKMR